MLKSLALSAALALSFAACSTAPVSPESANARPPAGCVGQTATRLPSKGDPTSCAGFGSTYTQQDLNRTGQYDLSRALPMLDPAITRH